jgi:peptide/nickel transport system permease protein
MLAYIVRRILYAIPILIGVNVLTFALFFIVNSPDDMARMQLGVKRVTTEAIDSWKKDHGYDRPLFYNSHSSDGTALTDTIFFSKSVRLFCLISVTRTTAEISLMTFTSACGPVCP